MQVTSSKSLGVFKKIALGKLLLHSLQYAQFKKGLITLLSMSTTIIFSMVKYYTLSLTICKLLLLPLLLLIKCQYFHLMK